METGGLIDLERGGKREVGLGGGVWVGRTLLVVDEVELADPLVTAKRMRMEGVKEESERVNFARTNWIFSPAGRINDDRRSHFRAVEIIGE